MRKLIIAAMTAAALNLAGTAASAQEPMVSAADPENVRRLFEAWGYSPSALARSNDQPLFTATVSGVQNVVVFGGCERGRNCTHVVLIASYSDVANPPFEWLNRQNFEYNLVTAMRREDGLLALRTGIMLGTSGVPVSVMRMALDDWIAANGEIARSAVQTGLARD